MGKYLHLYSTEQAFEADYNGAAYLEPWVSLTLDVDRVDYNKAPVPPTPVDPAEMPLTFEILSAGNLLWFNKGGNNPTATIQYSKNGGAWTDITSTLAGTPISVLAGDVVQFKHNSMEDLCGSNFFGDSGMSYKVKGNIVSMIVSSGFEDVTELPSNAPFGVFSNLFTECGGLTDAGELVLPLVTATKTCYTAMFTSTKYADKTQTSGCGNLVVGPEIRASVLEQGACVDMFNGCSNLNYLKCLATTNTYATSTWLNGVSATGTFVKAASMTNWTRDASGIPAGWTVEDAS